MAVNGHKSKSLLKNFHPFPSTLCYGSVLQRHIHKKTANDSKCKDSRLCPEGAQY